MEDPGGVGLHPEPSEVVSGHIRLLYRLALSGWNSVPVPPHWVFMGIWTLLHGSPLPSRILPAIPPKPTNTIRCVSNTFLS